LDGRSLLSSVEWEPICVSAEASEVFDGAWSAGIVGVVCTVKDEVEVKVSATMPMLDGGAAGDTDSTGVVVDSGNWTWGCVGDGSCSLQDDVNVAETEALFPFVVDRTVTYFVCSKVVPKIVAVDITVESALEDSNSVATGSSFSGGDESTSQKRLQKSRRSLSRRWLSSLIVWQLSNRRRRFDITPQHDCRRPQH
jgi:hypothetical protein